MEKERHERLSDPTTSWRTESGKELWEKSSEQREFRELIESQLRRTFSSIKTNWEVILNVFSYKQQLILSSLFDLLHVMFKNYEVYDLTHIYSDSISFQLELVSLSQILGSWIIPFLSKIINDSLFIGSFPSAYKYQQVSSQSKMTNQTLFPSSSQYF